MSDDTRSTRFRGAFKNALVWGTVWGVLGSAVATVFRLKDNIPLPGALLDGIGMGIRFGFVGGIAGAVFATYIALAYSGKRLTEINWLKFALGGTVLAGVLVPTFLQTMNVVTGGDMVPWHLVFDDTLWSALFGGITAGGTMKLAQLDAARNPDAVQEPLDSMEQQSVAAGEAPNFTKAQRSKANEKR